MHAAYLKFARKHVYLMKEFTRKIQLRWSDMDPNFHIRHSVYYDLGAKLRMDFLMGNGLTPAVMTQYNFGPILFREEALFKREVRYGDELVMDVKLSRLKKDYSRFGMRHNLMRGEELCAVLNVEGAFIDTLKRRITAPPQVGSELIEAMPRTEDFTYYDQE